MSIPSFPWRAVSAASLVLILSACAAEGPAAEQRTAQQRAESERREAYRAADAAREQANIEQLAKTDPERAKRSVDRIEARKKTCGDDYHAPRIGMTLEKALQCLGALRLQTQQSRSGGILSTYKAENGLWLEEYGGRLTGWGVAAP